MSKIVVVFESEELDHKKYDAIINELKALGKLSIESRPSHVAFDKNGKWCVIDVWDSAEALNEFVSATLMPIFLKLEITPPQPVVYPVHNYMGIKVEELILD